jgi:hypothetical protein
VLADSVGYRWAFAGQLPILAAGITAIWLLCRYRLPGDSTTADKKPPRRSLRDLDWAGFTALFAWEGSLMTALSLQTHERADSAKVAASSCFIVAGVFLALFVAIEFRWATRPLMPWSLVGRRDLLGACPQHCLAYEPDRHPAQPSLPAPSSPRSSSCRRAAAARALDTEQALSAAHRYYYVPPVYEILLLIKPSRAGYYMSPLGPSILVGGLVVGFTIAKTGKLKALVASLSIVASVGAAGLAIFCSNAEAMPSWTRWLLPVRAVSRMA